MWWGGPAPPGGGGRLAGAGWGREPLRPCRDWTAPPSHELSCGSESGAMADQSPELSSGRVRSTLRWDRPSLHGHGVWGEIHVRHRARSRPGGDWDPVRRDGGTSARPVREPGDPDYGGGLSGQCAARRTGRTPPRLCLRLAEFEDGGFALFWRGSFPRTSN